MKQQKQQKEYGKKFFVPILLILAVLPLITNAHIYDNGLSKQLWSSANGQVPFRSRKSVFPLHRLLL